MSKHPTISIVIIYLVAIHLTVISNVFAQDAPGEKLNLREIIEIALQENPEFRAAQKAWDAAKAKIPQAKDFADPNFSVMFNKVPGGGTDIIGPNDSMYRITQMLPFPGKRGLKEKIAQKGADIARAFKLYLC